MQVGVLLTLFTSLQAIHAQQQARSSNECYELPVVIVSALNQSFPDLNCNHLRYPAEFCLKVPIQTRVEVIDNGDGDLNCINGARTAVYEQSKANYRGQTSLFFKKHQFNLQFPKQMPFLGMVENKAFVMNGPFIDCSLLRNHLAHWLYRATGRYSVNTRHTIVYMRTNPGQEELTYVGIYLLLEKPTYDKDHENLASLNAVCAALDPKVMTGGWAWSNDPPNYGSYSPNMVVDRYQNEFGMGERPMLAYPHGSLLSQQMRDYFVNTETGFLPQLYRVLWNNMTTPLELQKHLDLGSFADYLLHTEMSLNVDAYRRSTFYFKDRNQTINAGPVWDFNLAYGNGARRHFKDWIYLQYTYWKRLMCNSQLASLVIQRWKTLRGSNYAKANDLAFGVWADENIMTFLNASAASLFRQLAQCRNGDWRSNTIQCAFVDTQTCNGTYAEQVNDLRDSVLNRAHWMDERIEQLYKPLSAKICSGVGDLPKFNCGLDGNDSGCLKNATKYYNAIPFPPIRKPYEGPSCHEIVASNFAASSFEETAADTPPYQKSSVDYCWLSAGSYVYSHQKEIELTPFCSGYGSCPQGPGAACNCSNGLFVEQHSCRRIDAENEHFMNKQHQIFASAIAAVTSTSESDQELLKHSPLSTAVTTVALVGAGVVLVIMGTWLVKEQDRGQRLNEFPPIFYGAVEQATIFSKQR
ncbi:hypothetical protein CCR75_007786 [Bremia lactucae]|uniref:Spore coat protein CotH n=1 Tax=Bremia lactucae TaxID=4779 RepID=A0A976IIS4_BRELC|nr:hypothetical protein CCR75_007786 [Bremia lactucae]